MKHRANHCNLVAGISLFVQTWLAPLFILHGGNDQICLPARVQTFQDQVPPGLAELKIYEGLCHEIHNEPAKSQTNHKNRIFMG